MITAPLSLMSPNACKKLGQNTPTHSPWSLPRTKGSHVSDEGRDFVTNVAPVVVNQSVKQMNEQINQLINKTINPSISKLVSQSIRLSISQISINE